MAALRLVGGARGARRAEFITTGLRALSSEANGQSRTGTSDTKLEKMTSMEENLGTEHRVFCPQLLDLIKVAKRSTITSTMPFDIKSGSGTSGDVKNLMEVMNADQNFSKTSFEEESLKETYYSLVRPPLVARCLVSPYKIDDPQAASLNEAYKSIIGLRVPYYISSRDLMITLKCMEKEDWAYFLDFLNAKRVLVIEDWSNSYGTLFGVGRYDQGLNCPPDGTEYYRGQCDASVKNGKARISSIIWKGNQVIACQVLVDIPIEQKKGDENGKKSSAKAEAIAMYYLLKLAISMGIKKLQVSTDNRTVDEVLRGMHEITEESDCKEIYKVLQFLKRYFSVLVSRWEPRENLYFADALIRYRGNQPRDKNSPYVRALLRKWAYYLNGYPIFYLTQKKSKLLKKLDDKWAQKPNIEDVCYLEVEESEKFDTFWHVCEALHPKSVFIAVKDDGSGELVEKLKQQFEEGCDFVVTAHDGYSVISFSLAHRAYSMESPKSLTVIYDSSVPKRALDEDDGLNLMLLTPDERRQGTTTSNIPEYSPISFASFHTKKKPPTPTKPRNPGVSGIF